MSDDLVLTALPHPGPRAPDRRPAVATTLKPLSGTLRAGEVVMEGIGRILDEAGCKGGMLDLAGLVCDPFRFVLPAHSDDGLHAAWYSATHAPEGPVIIREGTAMLGMKEGAPFLHCHGIWEETSGKTHMGHLLPFDSIVARDHAVSGLGAPAAWLEALPDAETAFTLFTPKGGDGGRHLLARLCPDEDVTLAVERLAREHGITRARVHGVGSVCVIRFTDGSVMDCIATEIRLTWATIEGGEARIGIAAVDTDGGVMRGTLIPGANPVGVTFELLIERLD
ncbi:DUF296 domain-containing protein [Frigidibacter sp. MR17.14]|uniref:DUF296 domain-containing protein n=1 Tax=Frigidibacter sp. MR17.14 TaxID=3126509 RepID=UPI003012B989